MNCFFKVMAAKKRLNFGQEAKLEKTSSYNRTYMFVKVEPVVKQYSKILKSRKSGGGGGGGG